MKGKITLITPPDFFENLNLSILFINISEKDQDIVSKFLADTDINCDLNFYVYNQDTNVSWLLYALNRCEYKFIDFDHNNNITSALGGYIAAKSNTFYKTKDENLTAIYTHLNNNRIIDIKEFLERIFND